MWQGKGYSAGRDLFGFGYDFRQSVRSGARALLARLHELSRRSGGRKLDVVTHSLGGLVVRALLAEAHEEFGALVRPETFWCCWRAGAGTLRSAAAVLAAAERVSLAGTTVPWAKPLVPPCLHPLLCGLALQACTLQQSAAQSSHHVRPSCSLL